MRPPVTFRESMPVKFAVTTMAVRGPQRKLMRERVVRMQRRGRKKANWPHSWGSYARSFQWAVAGYIGSAARQCIRAQNLPSVRLQWLASSSPGIAANAPDELVKFQRN